MRIYLTEQPDSIPVVYDRYWNGKLIEINAWVVMNDAE